MNISGLSQDYLRIISGLSQDYLRIISVLSRDYLRIISGLSQDYLRIISGLSRDYLRIISGLSQDYLRIISVLFSHVCPHTVGYKLVRTNQSLISGKCLHRCPQPAQYRYKACLFIFVMI
jgi:hypothetical protein